MEGDHPNFYEIGTIVIWVCAILNIFGCILALIGITHDDMSLTTVGVILSLVGGLVFAGLLSIPVFDTIKDTYDYIKNRSADKRQRKNDIHKV